MDFTSKLKEIVAQGLVPTVECTSCGFQHCCFEGSIGKVEEIFNRPCDKCGSSNEFLGKDVDL